MTVGELSDLRENGSLATRLHRALRWLVSPLRPFAVVLFPDRMLRPDVVAGRYGWPLMSVVICTCIAAFALGSRLDVGPDVRAENAGSPPAATAGKNETKAQELKTDREIDEEIAKRTAVVRVKLGLDAALKTPFKILAFGLLLLLFARFIGGKPTMPRVVTVAALASVPGAVRSLVTAVVAWRQPSVLPGEMDSLLQFPRVIPDGHPVLARLLSSVDVFTVWSFIILAIGFCAAADVKRRKGFVAVGVGIVLYLLVTNLIMGGGR